MFNILHLVLRHSAAPVALDELDLMCSSVEAHVVMTGDHHLLVSRVAQEDIRACGDQHAWLPTLSRAQRQPHKLLRQHLYIFQEIGTRKFDIDELVHKLLSRLEALDKDDKLMPKKSNNFRGTSIRQVHPSV